MEFFVRGVITLPEDLCKDVLLYSQKYTTNTIQSNSDYEKFVEDWLKTATYEEFKRMKEVNWDIDSDFGMGGGEFIGVDADGDGHISEEEFKNFQKLINEGHRLKLKEGSSYTEVHQTLNRFAISAWQACIVQKYSKEPIPDEEKQVVVIDNDNDHGLCKEITPIGNDKIRILIWYNTPYDEPRPKITQIVVFGGKVIEEDSFKEGDVIAGKLLMIVEREPRKALSITILTERGEIAHDLPAFDLQPLNLKRFVFQLDLSTLEPSKVYTFRLPPAYKSIAAFHSSNLGASGLWPNSLQEWQFSTGASVMTSNRKLDIIVTAIYDQSDIWDVTIANKSVDDETLCEVQLPDGYLITSGAYQLKVDWREGDLIPGTLHMCNADSLVSFFPKDNRTFQARIQGWCATEDADGQNRPFSLITYAIGIRSKSDENIQHKIELISNNTNFKLQDSDYISTGWIGFKTELPTEDDAKKAPSYTFQFNPEKDEYTHNRILSDFASIKYIIGIKHPNLPIEFLETSTEQI